MKSVVDIYQCAASILGTSGGNTDDMIESLDIMSAGRIDPATMVTHIGGLNAAISTTLNLPSITGWKKLIYTNIEMELTAIADSARKGEDDHLFADLAAITSKSQGLWSAEASL